MSCTFFPNATLTQERQQKLLIAGAHPLNIDPNLVSRLPTPILCFETPEDEVTIELDWIVVTPAGVPQAGLSLTMGSNTQITNAQGEASFDFTIGIGDAIALTLTITDTGGAPQANLTVVLAAVQKSTNGQGQVSFNISSKGTVS